MNKKVMVIYHGDCQDGFMSAVIAQRYFADKSVEPSFVQGFYGPGSFSDMEKTEDHDVYLLDYCLPESELREMAKHAKRIVVIDHHVAVEDTLVKLQAEGVIESYYSIDRSGAGLCWDYFYPGVDRPVLVDYVEDRDLFKKRFEHCDDVYLALSSYPMTFHAWQPLLDGPISRLIDEGKILSAKRYRDIADILKRGLIRAKFGGYDVPAVNAPHEMASDIGGLLADSEPFSLVFSYESNGVKLSLRSARGYGLDVNKIAGQFFRGGGHKHAAGAVVPVNSLRFEQDVDNQIVMRFDTSVSASIKKSMEALNNRAA